MSPLARRFTRWSTAANGKKRKEFMTPTYTDQLPRKSRRSRRSRYVSYVPSPNFFAPRIPTHFEPMYDDEYNLINGGYSMPFYAGDALMYYDTNEYRSHPNRKRPSAHSLYGLPQFPDLPVSAAAAIASMEGLPLPPQMPSFNADFDFSFDLPPLPSVDRPSKGAKLVKAKIVYPKGTGARATLTKLDFALGRLDTLNRQLRVAEARVAATKSRIADNQRRINALNRIRSKLAVLAKQIAALETKVGADPLIQAEVVKVTQSADLREWVQNLA